MNKHAYLIIAHDKPQQLTLLIKTLDSVYNDIFIHIDSKSKEYTEGCLDKISKVCVNSKVYFSIKTNVIWGGYSQIESELLLLELGLEKGNYSRFHLLSGSDFPIKPINYIYTYFESMSDREFVMFDYDQNKESFYDRFDQYHFFIERFGRKYPLLVSLDSLFVKFQKKIGIKRNRKTNFEFKKGANWFSITNNLAKFVISQRDFIKESFKRSKCCDEIFLQTIIYNSEFREKLYFDKNAGRYHNSRLIDWTRGNPYVFKEQDFDVLVNSPYCFARKFDIKIDGKILEKLSHLD